MGNPVTWTDEWQVFLVAAQLGVLLVAAAVAGWQVLEARRLRLERNRPFVVVDFDIDESKGYLLFFEVTNMGTSLARDVQIAIEPPLESAIDVEVSKLKMLNEGIASLPPGKKLRTFFDMSFRRNEERPDLPMTYTATVHYADEQRKREFTETYDLDLDQYMNMQFVTNHGLDDIYEEFKRTRTMMEKWGRGGSGGLLTLTPEQARDESARTSKRMKAHRRLREDAERRATGAQTGTPDDDTA
ncbi:MAG TPA: hypothetical protein VF176_00620 [Solirubrobacterales bacterium]